MVFMAATAGVMPADGATRGRKPKPSYSEERNTKTATVTQTPTPTPKPAPKATPMPMLATAAPTPAASTTPTNTLNGKAATPQREICVPLLRFIIPDTGLTRQYQSIRLTPRFSGGGGSADNTSHVPKGYGTRTCWQLNHLCEGSIQVTFRAGIQYVELQPEATSCGLGNSGAGNFTCQNRNHCRMRFSVRTRAYLHPNPRSVKLIVGVLPSLFKSRAKLDAEILILRQQ